MGIDRKNFCAVIKSENLNFTTKPILLENKNSPVKISLKKEGDVIQVIQITCSCGNRIDLVCEYENEDISEFK